MAATVRVELGTQCPELQDGLQARIHDPLWLLARQWQFGEFDGEDTGSPAAAQVVIESAPLSLSTGTSIHFEWRPTLFSSRACA